MQFEPPRTPRFAKEIREELNHDGHDEIQETMEPRGYNLPALPLGVLGVLGG